ncbi:MAG: Asp-tRNA(Asn)/Glu-tRNA(Gln) amidotransferase subunit GatB [Oscillibacter sp.]|nr:Asp-tRNA(Asn)/Glu-tRNA(Gln) amidotransferase subunit GatB [Oscillibacter sp.]
MRERWETVIGLEVHAELSTASKIFCGCSTAFGGEPNTRCCPVCMGLPGTLPVLNEKVLEYAVRAGLALHCEIDRETRFDRKNYFYPDLPKAYQISQLYRPIARNGYVDIVADGAEKRIRIHEMHMEEDAGKLVHSEFERVTYPDYNRAGTPLLEIVSEPDFRSSAEVLAYLEKIRSLFTYMGISDCKMQEGSMRADVNLSVRPMGETAYGVRTETKNINSLRAIEHAIESERSRQIHVITNGGKVIQETRRWNDDLKTSVPMRSKENAPDYRYFPEPDLPAIHISEAFLQAARESLPEFAEERQARFVKEYGLPENDAARLVARRETAELFEAVVAQGAGAHSAANWLVVHVPHVLKTLSESAEDAHPDASELAELIRRTERGEISRPDALKVLGALLSAETPFGVADYIRENGMAVENDESALEDAVRRVIAANPKAVEEYRSGKTKAIGFLIGQAMKELKGKSAPATVHERMEAALREPPSVTA